MNYRLKKPGIILSKILLTAGISSAWVLRQRLESRALANKWTVHSWKNLLKILNHVTIWHLLKWVKWVEVVKVIWVSVDRQICINQTQLLVLRTVPLLYSKKWKIDNQQKRNSHCSTNMLTQFNKHIESNTLALSSLCLIFWEYA